MTENEQKQIEEMAKDVCVNCMSDGCASGRCAFQFDCPLDINTVKKLYAKGYRKVERGEWIPYGMNMNGTVGNWKCSVCNKSSLKPSDFCGSCGADMRGDLDNEQRTNN